MVAMSNGRTSCSIRPIDPSFAARLGGAGFLFRAPLRRKRLAGLALLLIACCIKEERHWAQWTADGKRRSWYSTVYHQLPAIEGRLWK